MAFDLSTAKPVDEVETLPKKGKFDLSSASIVDKPVDKPVEKPPSLFSRSIDRLRLGASDALSTQMGETYGRSGDPAQRDDLSYVGKRVKVLGGDVIPAVSDVVADTTISAGKAVLPQALQNKIASGAQYVANSAPVKLVGKGLDAWESASPETYAAAGELANIGLAVAPVPKIPLKDFGASKRLAKSVAKTRANELKHVFTPDRPITGKIPAGDYVIDKNLLQTKEFVPNKKWQAVIDEVSDIPEINPRKSATANRIVLKKAVTKTKRSLDDKLTGQPPISRKDVYDAIDDAKDEIMASPYVVGDAQTSAQKMSVVFDKLIDQKMVDDAISPKDLIDVRTQFDNMVKADNPNLLTPGGSAGKVTTQKLRQSLNNLVEQKVPTAGVKEDLAKMHKLLKGDDYLAKVAESEGNNRFSRYLANVENRTGIKHPTTPAYAARTILDAPALVLTGTAALLTGGARHVAEGAGRNSAAFQRMLASAMRNAPEVASKGVIIDTLNRKKKENN